MTRYFNKYGLYDYSVGLITSVTPEDNGLVYTKINLLFNLKPAEIEMYRDTHVHKCGYTSRNFGIRGVELGSELIDGHGFPEGEVDL